MRYLGKKPLDVSTIRINPMQKTDLVLREIDHIEENLRKLSKKCHAKRHKLKAHIEEMDLREQELVETMTSFQNTFLSEGQKYSGPSVDKFVRFMIENFKKGREHIGKLRLRTSSLKVQYQKICSQLTQKRLLGENLQEVDFEQLHIANKHQVDKIEKQNLLLMELKRMNGRSNLLLSNTKKVLLKKMNELQDIKDTIDYTSNLIVKLDIESDRVSMDLENAKREYDAIRFKNETYEVPDVLDYIKTKAELGVVQKNLKRWERRKQIKELSLIAAVRELKSSGAFGKFKATLEQEISSMEFLAEGMFQFVFEKKDTARKIKRQNRVSNRKRIN